MIFPFTQAVPCYNTWRQEYYNGNKTAAAKLILFGFNDLWIFARRCATEKEDAIEALLTGTRTALLALNESFCETSCDFIQTKKEFIKLAVASTPSANKEVLEFEQEMFALNASFYDQFLQNDKIFDLISHAGDENDIEFFLAYHVAKISFEEMAAQYRVTLKDVLESLLRSTRLMISFIDNPDILNEDGNKIILPSLPPDSTIGTTSKKPLRMPEYPNEELVARFKNSVLRKYLVYMYLPDRKRFISALLEQLPENFGCRRMGFEN